MQEEPSEVRLATSREARSNRFEALLRARRIVAESHPGPAAGADGEPLATMARDEAFADLPEPVEAAAVEAAAPALPDPQRSALPMGLFGQISSQLQRLDAQRAQLASLLEDAKP